MSPEFLESALRQAAEAIRTADALLIGAGAGMGVDSGLPDFRGDEGFWRAYPPFARRKLSFVDLANPVWFHRDPGQAWGFYGHRMNLYRKTAPHDGFRRLRDWGESRPRGYFVFTSNVDGHFQRAGFSAERVVECHGSIHHLQCATPCEDDVWSADGLAIAVGESDFRAQLPLPACRNCGAVARPNVLMFGDGQWLESRTDGQCRRYERWLAKAEAGRLVTIECGAGTAVPTVRHHCERRPGTLIRINPREPKVPEGGISLPLGAGEAIGRIGEILSVQE
jgi:NAD-dependent SIR2 family protein deacetylase